MYYALIICSVIMFGVCFKFKDIYRERKGSNFEISLLYTFISSVSGLVAFCVLNGFKPEFSAFSFIMALLAAFNSIAFSFFSFKALKNTNLSVFSLFSMLGGMALPFLQGILFYSEALTVSKIVCFLFISIAMFLTVEKGNKKSAVLYYIGIFVLNGMSGVLSKIFTSAPFEKTSAAGYTILISLCSIVLSGLLMVYFSRKNKTSFKSSLSDIGIISASGITNRIANFWLVIALMHVDASVQYPLVTGGTIIVSTIICFFGKNKPSKKDVVSVIIAFIGTVALFAIPM